MFDQQCRLAGDALSALCSACVLLVFRLCSVFPCVLYLLLYLLHSESEREENE